MTHQVPELPLEPYCNLTAAIVLAIILAALIFVAPDEATRAKLERIEKIVHIFLLLAISMSAIIPGAPAYAMV